MRSSAGQRAMELREAHREKVARNEVRVDKVWARPCRAYNVQIELDPRTKASLGETQQTLKRAGPNLLVCPQKIPHVSVAWLLTVHASYPVAKDSLWERHGEEWTAELNRIVAQSTGFRITYEHVVATDSAVIALARPAEPVNRIREMIRERLRCPPKPATRQIWCILRCFAIAVRSLTRRSSLLCSRRTRAPKPQPRSTSWSSRRS